MAAKLQDTAGRPSATVHKLRPGRAKGHGGSKRAAAAATKKPPAPAVPSQPTDAQIRANQQDRLIALHAQHRAKENAEAIASEALQTARGEKKLVRAAIQNAGFPLELYDEANKKLKLKTKKTDLVAYEKTRALIFDAFGLPVGPQPELALEGVPEAAKPALHWESQGYFDGINGNPSDPSAAGVPGDCVQDYMKGYSQAMARNAAGIGLLKDDPPAAAAPPLMVGEDPKKAAAKASAKAAAKKDGEAGQPDWKGYDLDPGKWTPDQAIAFADWYMNLSPNAQVTVVHVGAESAFDLANAQECASIEDVLKAIQGGGAVDEPFEASQEELAGQAGRREREAD